MHSLGTQREGERTAHRAGAREMNTTDLIAQWTMSGARRDADGRFRVIAEKQARTDQKPPAGSFQIKGADGSWQPLRKDEKKKH